MYSFSPKYDVKQLFDQYYIGLVEFSFHILGCDEEARDVVQDVFVKLLMNDKLLENKDKVKSYLYSMVKNACFNELRSKEINNRFVDFQKENPAEEEDVLEALIYAESIQHLYQAMETLPEACKKVATLTFLQEKSNKEAAELTETSINTVKTHKRRAVKLLRERLIPTIKTAKTFFLFFF